MILILLLAIPHEGTVNYGTVEVNTFGPEDSRRTQVIFWDRDGNCLAWSGARTTESSASVAGG